jgi:hypothetical protein
MVPGHFTVEGATMWRYFLLFGILAASPAIGLCDTVQFAVNPADIGTVFRGGSVDLFSSGLNGTVVSGQALSLDLVLSGSVLARLYATDPAALGVELEIYTNAAGAPGFAGPTTGFLLAPNGSQFGGSQVAGGADGSNGTFEVGLVSFAPGNLNGESIFDISGAHFDITLPSGGYTVTNAELLFSLNASDNGLEFGTAQQLSEPSTLLMSLLGFGIVLAAWRREPKRTSNYMQ